MKLLGTVQVKNGLLLLDDSKISVLGGEVDHMVEKWELQRVRVNILMTDQPLWLKRQKSYFSNHFKCVIKASATPSLAVAEVVFI